VTSPHSVSEDARPDPFKLASEAAWAGFNQWRNPGDYAHLVVVALRDAGLLASSAQPIAVTEEEVEAAARAFIDGWAEDVNDVECPSWDERDDDDQAFWLSHMRAALEVAARIRTDRETAEAE
jgi:hypothetical protein